MKNIPITKESYDKLKETLHHLKSIERSKAIKSIEIARDHGDLSENAEYHAAKEHQAFIESKIKNISSKLSNLQVVDVKKLHSSKIIFGATIEIYNINTKKRVLWKIVGEDEANIKENKISIYAPISRKLIGKTIGYKFEYTIHKNKNILEVKSIKFV